MSTSSQILQAAQLAEGKVALIRAIAAAERTRLALGAVADQIVGALQPTAETLGQALGLPIDVYSIFSEEVSRSIILAIRIFRLWCLNSTLEMQVIRSSAAAPLSQLISLLEPALRKESGLGPWQIVSAAGTKPCVGLWLGGMISKLLPQRVGLASRRGRSCWAACGG